MSIMDKATAHFADRMSGSLLELQVPEWDETIYYKPSISLKSQAPISKLLAEGKSEEALVASLIIRALTAEGKPLFRPADKVMLLNKTDPAIISRIIKEISDNDALSSEEAGNG